MSGVKVSFRQDRDRWQVEYYLEHRRKRPLFLTEAEAINFSRRISLGIKPENRDSITIDEAGKKYFERESMLKAPKSRTNDKRYINLHFHFMTYERGIERLSSVELEDMEAFRDWLKVQTEYDGKPMKMGNSSINRCLRVMKRFYVKCIHWKYISDTPCKYLEFLDAEANSRAAMTKEQFMKLHSTSPKWFSDILEFMHLTGSPAICVERIEWKDVDLVGRTFSIWRRKGARAKVKRVKLVMTDQVFALFARIRNSQGFNEGPVFRDMDGHKMLADRVTVVGNDLIRAAGIKGVTLYGLRHALATDLTTANVATEIVRQAMGHQSISTTQGYANKVANFAIKGAIESVRGGEILPPEDFALRTEVTKKLVK